MSRDPSILRPPHPSLPRLVAHADWGTSAAKRWMARAVRDDGYYYILPPDPVGALDEWLPRLKALAGEGETTVLGLDFPIGLPAAYAATAGISDFLDALPRFGRGKWAEFYTVAETAEQISLRRPFYPARPGGSSHEHLLEGLGLGTSDELFRQCERSTVDRGAASPLFFLVGAKQVGKAAISGWRDLLTSALAEYGINFAIWPFAGNLRDLIRGRSFVVVESYPAEAYPLRRFAEFGILPGYEFPSEPAALQLRGDPHEEDPISVVRRLGIGQFQPDAHVYARSKRWVVMGLDMASPWNPHGDGPTWSYRVCQTCGLRHNADQPACPRCNTAAPGHALASYEFAGFIARQDESPILDEEERYAERNLVSTHPQWDGDVIGRWTAGINWALRLSHNEEVRWVNEGKPPTVKDVQDGTPLLHTGAKGYFLCPSCGRMLTPPAPEQRPTGGRRNARTGRTTDDNNGHSDACSLRGNSPQPLPPGAKVQDPKNLQPDAQGLIRRMDKPELRVFLPAADRATGAAVIICPGGGYSLLDYKTHVAEFVADYRQQGIAVIALLYKVPTTAELALKEGQRAIRLVRSRAKDWNLDPRKIGMQGYSAGGHDVERKTRRQLNGDMLAGAVAGRTATAEGLAIFPRAAASTGLRSARR